MSFQLNIEHQIAWIVLNQEDEKVNTLGKEMIAGFGSVLDQVEKDDDIRAVVMISGKENNFIAGADIKMFDTFTTEEEFAAFIKTGTDLLDRIERFGKPVIAAINGACIGGGLEVVMACHYRIATDDPSTKFATPEVKLGLLPGAGGTQRMPRLVGLPNALDIMLTGKNVFPRQAKRMGMVDELTHRHGLRQAAIYRAEKLAGGKRTERKLPFTAKMLTHTAARNIAFKKATETVMRQTRGNYPAPLRIIESAKAGLTLSRDNGFETERTLFSQLAFTPESAALRRLFFGMQAVKENPMKDKALKINRLGVLGAGLMGAGIADVSASNGYRVSLKDRDTKSAVKGFDGIRRDIDKKVKKRIISRFQGDEQLARITPTESYDHFRNIPIVIEAVFEDLKIKHAVIKEVEAVSPDVIFASNTSSLPIADIAKGAQKPENVVGMHYFSPVQKMPLLEIIKTHKTSEEAISTAYEIGLKQGKTVIVVHDGPGFYTTRILAPFINEALLLLGEGAKIEDIESAMKDFGFPVGPIALIDEVGIDVASHVSDTLSPMFKKRGVEPGDYAKKLYDDGFLGRKNGKGFYMYGEKKKKEINRDIYRYFGGSERKSFDKKEIQDRMSSVMLNEALLCLEENILDSARDGDLGAVLGLGFPPFHGGPFSYIDHIGAKEVQSLMNDLMEKHGPRFKAATILEEYARQGKKFRE
ncbi:MAG: enoyl-CoA hydratase/isomerase family protein [Balneolia bacterium]|nr:enoyl-CoA hydratase/isomerase family protein [Balneolia bacterium]